MKSKPNATVIYDRELAISIAGGSPDVAAELLALLAQDLPILAEALRQAFASGNQEELHRLTHKLHGSASYCGTLALKEAARNLESVLPEAGADTITATYTQLLDEIQRLMEFCRT